jgi:hypothetical protein
VILVDPNARAKASALVRSWDDRIVVNVPSVSVATSTPSSSTVKRLPTATPVPTEILDNDDATIPNTGGDENSSDEPIIQVNWDALGNALRKFWDSLRNIKINLNTTDRK